MADYQEITAKISDALNAADQCSTIETVANYDLLENQLEELDSLVRQSFRSHVAFSPLLDNLRKGGQLTDEDLKTLRSMIIGDADQYLKYDDDYQQSKDELRKILGRIRQLKTQQLGFETLAQLRVLCREAVSALVPTLHYLEAKERVRNFEQHTKGPLTSDARRVLADIVEGLAN